MSQRHSIDEYLETIYFLAFPIGEYSPQSGGSSPTLASRVAEMLGVSRASAGEMLKRLEKEGLLRGGARLRGRHRRDVLGRHGRADGGEARPPGSLSPWLARRPCVRAGREQRA